MTSAENNDIYGGSNDKPLQTYQWGRLSKGSYCFSCGMLIHIINEDLNFNGDIQELIGTWAADSGDPPEGSPL